MKITALTVFTSPETSKRVSVWADFEVSLQPRVLGADEETGDEGWQQGWEIRDLRDDQRLGWAIKDDKEGVWKPFISAGAYRNVDESLGDVYDRTGSYGPDKRHRAGSAGQGEAIEWAETRERAFAEILYQLTKRGAKRATSLARIHMDDLLEELG